MIVLDQGLSRLLCLFAVVASCPLPFAQNPRNLGSERTFGVPIALFSLGLGAEVLKVWSTDQQHQHCSPPPNLLEMQTLGPTTDLLSQKF